MTKRDDNRYREDVCIGFAIYCDEHGLSKEEGIELAAHLGVALAIVAEDREHVT